MLGGTVFFVFYPVTVPGMILLSACGLYPCGGMDGEDEESDENFAKRLKLFEHIGINTVMLSLLLQFMLTMLMFQGRPCLS